MNTLVIGSSSYLGNNIIRHLNQEKELVSGISRSNLGKTNFTNLLFTNLNELINIITSNKYSHIFYCFNSYFKNPTKKQVNEMYDVNFIFPKKIIEKLTENKHDIKIIFFSSYFNFIETPKESFDYKLTKLKLSNFTQNLDNPNIHEIFISDVFGKNDKRSKILNLIINNLKMNNALELTNPKNKINLIHIDDLIKFTFAILKSNETKAYFFSKYSISVESLHNLVFDILKNHQKNFDFYFEEESRLNLNIDLNYGDETINNIKKIIKYH